MHTQHRSPCASYSTAHFSTPPPRRTPSRKAASDSWQRQHRASTSTTRASSIGAVVDVAEAIRRRRVEKVSCVALTRPREGRRALAESRHGKSHQILAACAAVTVRAGGARGGGVTTQSADERGAQSRGGLSTSRCASILHRRRISPIIAPHLPRVDPGDPSTDGTRPPSTQDHTATHRHSHPARKPQRGTLAAERSWLAASHGRGSVGR